jgi:hypothetical protein
MLSAAHFYAPESVEMGSLEAPVQVGKRVFLCHFILYTQNGIILPRQARDQHRKS